MALVAFARAEGEHVELGQRVQRVRARPREVDDAVARADLGDLTALPRQSLPGQDVEDLLGAAVLVRERRPGAFTYLDPPQADPDAARILAEIRPGRMQVADGQLAASGFVEVGEPHG